MCWEDGGNCATHLGGIKRPLLCADNWDYLPLVRLQQPLHCLAARWFVHVITINDDTSELGMLLFKLNFV